MTWPLFSDVQIVAIARVIADTNDGLTGTEIDALFASFRIRDTSGVSTKYKRLAFLMGALQGQGSRASGNRVVALVEQALTPVRFVDEPHRFDELRARLNQRLALCGMSLNESGVVEVGVIAATLAESAAAADYIVGELRRRNSHPKVLEFCCTELLQRDLFHGLHEATKSVLDRLRTSTGLGLDGAVLIDECFKLTNGVPHISINGLNDDSDLSEHKGFHMLLKGVVGHWRNPTAHRTRVEVDVQKQDVLEALGMLSYIHRVLDGARNQHDDTPV